MIRESKAINCVAVLRLDDETYRRHFGKTTMKVVFIGGGAHRLVAILRGLLAQENLFHDGEICLYDLDASRAEAVGRIVMKSPEFRATHCRITWGKSLDRALEGADAVGVILMAGSALSYALGDQVCWRRGFVPSDNLSPNGALLGVKTAPILLDLARRMERLCPDAWLVNFANPIAVLSGMVNLHTKIKALGVCAGYSNHYNDIGRIFGKDEPRYDLDVDTVGVNHLSFIVRGTLAGRDLFPKLDRRAVKNWKMCSFSSHWSERHRKNITNSVTRLVDLYRRLGLLIFSTEEDGMLHLDYEETLKRKLQTKQAARLSRSQVAAGVKRSWESRAEANKVFAAHVNHDLPDAFWKQQEASSVFCRADDHIFVKALRGIGGLEKVKVVTSRINGGAIANLPEDVVGEYSHFLYKNEATPVATHRVPDVGHGLISSLATHQTMLAHACATGDPKLLAHALLIYPIRPYSRATRDLHRELIAVNRDEMPKSLRQTDDYL
jgi:6-phospho-beta-glucosidase